MFLSKVLIIFLLLVVAPVFAIQISAPDRAENGAVIPVAIKLDKPLLAGQQLDLLVNGETAAQVKVVSGKLSAFSTRVKGSQNTTTVAARIHANGSELDSASQNITVTITAPMVSSPTVASIMKVKAQNGEIKLLMTSENGFAGIIFLQDTGFHVEISGSSVISKNPYISANGEFSDQATASFIAQSSTALAEAKTKRQGDEAKAKQLTDETNAKSKRIADEAEAKRLDVLKNIARENDREVAAVEQRERDEVDAKEKQKADKAFKTSLSKLNAGELFALADKNRNAGELEQAREVLLTLITKFPNNPLVAIAAQQMTQLPPPAQETAPITAKSPASAAQNKVTNRDAGLEEMSDAFRAPKK